MRTVFRETSASRRGVFRSSTWVALSAGAMLALSACGGGGGGDGGGGNPPPQAPNPPGNAAPVVNAGVDQTVQLPTNTLQLQGSATDDNLPANSTLTYQWTSAPAEGVAFADAAAPATTATFAAAGSYTLTLTVSDGAASGSDSLTVTVQSAGAGAGVYPAPDLDENAPDRGWTRVSPAEAGMDAGLLAQAQAFAETAGGAGMIVRGGRLVHSWGNIDERFASQSATKSIGGVALGLAMDEGLINLRELANTYLPNVGVNPNPPPQNDPQQLAKITVLQLATHTAGFEKPGGYGALLFEPGTTWAYSDGGLNWLADLLTHTYGQDLRDLLAARVWVRLGLNFGDPTNFDDIAWRDSSFRPEPRPDGLQYRELASGIATNANAMARVGLLFLRNGVWSDGPILSEAFINTVKTPPPEIANAAIADPVNFPGATTNYGVLWWTNATGMLANVPRDAFWAWGQGESLIVVVPSLDLVVSRIGPIGSFDLPRTFGGGQWNADYAILAPFLDPIMQSVGTP